jgi:hypothetical protein
MPSLTIPLPDAAATTPLASPASLLDQCEDEDEHGDERDFKVEATDNDTLNKNENEASSPATTTDDAEAAKDDAITNATKDA